MNNRQKQINHTYLAYIQISKQHIQLFFNQFVIKLVTFLQYALLRYLINMLLIKRDKVIDLLIDYILCIQNRSRYFKGQNLEIHHMDKYNTK